MGHNSVADIIGLSSFVSRCWLPNLRNPSKFWDNSNL